MAKAKVQFILGSCFLTGAAVILTFVSLGTQQWASADAYYGTERLNDNVYMGLFSGVFNQQYGAPYEIKLQLFCLADSNVCAMLCENNNDPYGDLRKMYEGRDITIRAGCGSTSRSVNNFKSRSLKAVNKESFHLLNAGLHICTILFLFISAFMGFISCVLAIWNTAANPYQVYFSIYAIYIYNAIASITALLAMILWGAMFAQGVQESIPTEKTYAEFTTKDATLGFSYWLILPAILFYIVSIVLLKLREYFISIEPQVKVPIEDNSDPVIYLY